MAVGFVNRIFVSFRGHDESPQLKKYNMHATLIGRVISRLPCLPDVFLVHTADYTIGQFQYVTSIAGKSLAKNGLNAARDK